MFNRRFNRLPQQVAAQACLLAAACLLPLLLSGCRSPVGYRNQADRAADRIIAEKQAAGLGKAEPFTVERPEDELRRRLLLDQHLPHVVDSTDGSFAIHTVITNTAPVLGEPVAPLHLSLIDVLQLGAHSSRDYQAQKENLFRAALSLDLERDEFRHTFAALLSSAASTDGSSGESVSVWDNSGRASVTQRLKSGAEMSAGIAVDLARLLTQGAASAFGIMADASISIPLWGGAGRLVNSEALTQADRNMLYSIYDFERYKRKFAVSLATTYLGVLQQGNQVVNSEQNYRRLIASTRRARRLADAGRLPEFQFDQSIQDELRARSRWIGAIQSYAGGLDRFKVDLGLPPDALIELDPSDLEMLTSIAARFTNSVHAADQETAPDDAPIMLEAPGQEGAGPFELPEDEALRLALTTRLDLRIAQAEVDDAERAVAIAASALKAGVTLSGAASVGERRSGGSAASDDARLSAGDGRYSAKFSMDLPFERTAQRNNYRTSLIERERTVRNLQALEDQIKLDVRKALRDLLEAREGLRIQIQAVQLSERRVASTDLFLQAGRAQIRDVLEAQESLLSAQNALTSAVVSYRIAELEIQRDMDLLEVNETGLWKEYTPGEQP